MSKKPESLPVIFRAETGSRHFHADIVAVFPTLAGTRDPSTCTVYADTGHSTGHRDWYGFTRPATESEAAPLLARVSAIYETGPDAITLKPCKRWTRHHDAARRASLES